MTTKLTEEQVQELIALYNLGVGVDKLTSKYKIHRNTIYGYLNSKRLKTIKYGKFDVNNVSNTIKYLNKLLKISPEFDFDTKELENLIKYYKDIAS